MGNLMEGQQPAAPNLTAIADRLRARFGSGTDSRMREALYSKLEQIVNLHGEAAYVVVATAAADAAGKHHPDRYFCKVVMTRLREKGIVASPEL